jgi:hypothetical protein
MASAEVDEVVEKAVRVGVYQELKLTFRETDTEKVAELRARHKSLTSTTTVFGTKALCEIQGGEVVTKFAFAPERFTDSASAAKAGYLYSWKYFGVYLGMLNPEAFLLASEYLAVFANNPSSGSEGPNAYMGPISKVTEVFTIGGHEVGYTAALLAGSKSRKTKIQAGKWVKWVYHDPELTSGIVAKRKATFKKRTGQSKNLLIGKVPPPLQRKAKKAAKLEQSQAQKNAKLKAIEAAKAVKDHTMSTRARV